MFDVARWRDRIELNWINFDLIQVNLVYWSYSSSRYRLIETWELDYELEGRLTLLLLQPQQLNNN